MSTPSRSQSLAIGGEDYLVCHERMEICQQENDRQMQTMLRQTKQLRKENENLMAQMLAACSSQSWQTQSQQTTSRQIA